MSDFHIKEILELKQFLLLDSRKDVRVTTCNIITKLTGSKESLQVICNEKELLETLLQFVIHPNIDSICSKDVLQTLTNVSAEENGASTLLSIESICIVNCMIKIIEDQESDLADYACLILANLTHTKYLCQLVFDRLQKFRVNLTQLVFIFSQVKYNKKNEKLHCLASIFQNISQLPEGRRAMLDREQCIYQRLLPFIDFKDSFMRRAAIIGTVHNCCFEEDEHEWLLSEAVDTASRLVYPLAGPDTFTEEENDSLPLDLQFLPDDKAREDYHQLRLLLLQALLQLCRLRKNRETLRNLNIYLILREYHKWEKDPKCLLMVEDLVNMLIRTEEEIGIDNVSSVDVPPEMAAKFDHMDSEIIKELQDG